MPFVFTTILDVAAARRLSDALFDPKDRLAVGEGLIKNPTGATLADIRDNVVEVVDALCEARPGMERAHMLRVILVRLCKVRANLKLKLKEKEKEDPDAADAPWARKAASACDKMLCAILTYRPGPNAINMYSFYDEMFGVLQWEPLPMSEECSAALQLFDAAGMAMGREYLSRNLYKEDCVHTRAHASLIGALRDLHNVSAAAASASSSAGR